MESAPLPQVGARATRVRMFTDADIVRFAEVSGDHNPVHLDDAYAARSPFGQRVAHGFLTGSLISAVIGMELLKHWKESYDRLPTHPCRAQ